MISALRGLLSDHHARPGRKSSWPVRLGLAASSWRPVRLSLTKTDTVGLGLAAISEQPGSCQPGHPSHLLCKVVGLASPMQPSLFQPARTALAYSQSLFEAHQPGPHPSIHPFNCNPDLPQGMRRGAAIADAGTSHSTGQPCEASRSGSSQHAQAVFRPAVC